MPDTAAPSLDLTLGHPAGRRRGDAPADPGAAGRGRAFRLRPHRHPRPVAAAHLPPPQAARRGRARRAAPGRGLGLLPADRPGRAPRILRPMLDAPRPRRSAAAGRSHAASRPCARSARRRRRPSSRASRPNGTASAPFMRRRRWSRRRCSRRLGDGRSAISSISAPAPAACCNCWRRAPRAPSGLDASHAMLSVARANLEKAGLTRHRAAAGRHLCAALPAQHLRSRRSSIRCCTTSTIRPARSARRRASWRPGGRILVVDFAPHRLEFLREAQAHRRLGFAPTQVAGWLDEAGLDCTLNREIAPPRKGDEQLTVSLWLGQDRRVVTDWPLS